MSNSKILAALGLLMMVGPAMASTAHQPSSASEVSNAAQVLLESGYAKIDPATGNLVLEKSVMDSLKSAGVAREWEHSSVISGGCQDSHGTQCY